MAMLAAQLIKIGAPDAVQVNQIDIPVVGENEVLIDVYAASVNPYNLKQREGKVPTPKIPITLGSDFSGVISSVGEGITEWQVGDEVYGQARGSWAEFAVASTSAFAKKPESLNFEMAAAVPLVATSAYEALVEAMQLKKGQKILIHGGAGGIGSMAIQLAKYLGAEVATTVSPDNAEFVRELGADHIIDYRSQDFSELLHNYDAVYDTVGGDTHERSYRVLRQGGRLVSMEQQPNAELDEKYKVEASLQGSRSTPERLNAVCELFDKGAIKVKIDREYPLAQAAEALEHLKTGSHRGKIILKIKPS
jgi:alcohol dehydrogenase